MGRYTCECSTCNGEHSWLLGGRNMASLVSQPQMETSRLYMNSWQCESRKAYTFGRSPVRPVRADGTIEVKLNFETHVGCIDSACAVYGEAQCPQDQILFVTIYTPHIWTRFMENQSLRYFCPSFCPNPIKFGICGEWPEKF